MRAWLLITTAMLALARALDLSASSMTAARSMGARCAAVHMGKGSSGKGFSSKPSKPAKTGSAAGPKGAKGFSSRTKDSFKYTGTVRPGTRSPTRLVPEGIMRPDYAADGIPKARGPLLPWQIEVKTARDIEAMRVAGRIAREVLDAAGRLVASAGPGLTTDEIDALVHEETVRALGFPGFLGLREVRAAVRCPPGETRRVPESPQLPRLPQVLLHVCQ